MIRKPTPTFNRVTSSTRLLLPCDSTWLAALKKKENWAWDRCTTVIYRWVHPRVHKNHADAKDVTQETITNVYRNLDAFRGQSSVTTWLLSIANNSLVDWLRRHNRHTQGRHSLDEALLPPISHSHSRQEISEIVSVALQQLRSRDRELLIQRYIDRLSYKAIAAAQGIPETTVSTRLTTARHNLRRQLQRLGVTEQFGKSSEIP